MDEDYPLNVSRTYPEVRDLAEVDTLVIAFLWRHPEIATTILRPVNTLGYYVAQRDRPLPPPALRPDASWASTR